MSLSVNQHNKRLEFRSTSHPDCRAIAVAFSWGILLLGLRKPVERAWILQPTAIVIGCIFLAVFVGFIAGVVPILNDLPAVDLVFTDMVMPGGMSGIDLAQEIRGQRPDIRMLFTSGYPGDPGINIDSFDEDVHWVRKPYKIRTIAQKIGDMLDD